MPVVTPHSLNHAAYPTFDTGETYRFYTELLGCKLIGALRREAVPSTGEQSPFLHTFFAMETGECIAFFEVDNLEVPDVDDGIPSWIRHIALNVESNEAVDAAKAHLEANGVEVVGPVDHDDTWYSIYFFDPNGIRVELTHQSHGLGEADAAEAEELVREWTSQRGQRM